MFFANISLEVAGRREGKSVYPMTVTPDTTALPPATEPTQLPPVSALAAMSRTTLPSRIPSSISWLTSLGAGRPGIRAVVMTTSASLVALSMSCRSASL